MGYPRPSKEAIPAPAGVSPYMNVAVPATKPTRLLTAYGVEHGGWEAFEWRATWRSLIVLPAIIGAAYVAWIKFDVQEPSLPGLTFLLYGAPWALGMYFAGRRRLTRLGWIVVFAAMAVLIAFSLIVAPAVAEWVNTTLIGWVLGPDMFTGSYDILGIA